MAREWDPGSSVPAALLIPYVALEWVTSQSASLHSGSNLSDCQLQQHLGAIQADCARASSQPKQQYASTLHIPSMFFPTPLQSPSITTQLVEHHTAVINWPEKKNPTHFLQWAPQIGWLHNKTMRGWEEMDSVSGFFLVFFKVFINSKNS